MQYVVLGPDLSWKVTLVREIPLWYHGQNDRCPPGAGGRTGKMGFLNKKPVIWQEGFQPLELNEDNVRAIFERCLAKETSLEKTSSILFYREFGYEKDDIGIVFDKTALHTNRKSIEYLYGQLAVTHGSEGILRMEDFEQSYFRSQMDRE